MCALHVRIISGNAKTVYGSIFARARQGDPDAGIEPGTKFEDLPDDWVCPECGVDVGGTFSRCWKCGTGQRED